MDEITKTNTSRILKFLQAFHLDFNDYSVWSYVRRKFRDAATTKPLIDESINYLEKNGWIERSRRPGYYRLTAKGKTFTSWEVELLKSNEEPESESVQKGWRSWFSFSKEPELHA